MEDILWHIEIPKLQSFLRHILHAMEGGVVFLHIVWSWLYLQSNMISML